MLSKMTKKKEQGFTLIELMIVIAIIGILAAIAIPQFAAYRTRSFNASANADLRNLATAQEAYYADKYTYAQSGDIDLLVSDYGAITSKGVTLSINTGSDTAYGMTAWHSSGDKSYHIYGPGGSVEALD